jgi:hypothetical protein
MRRVGWALALLFLAVGLAAAQPADLRGYLPKEGAAGEPKAFTPTTLYEYIDGAADLFVGYGVVQVVAGTYGTGESPTTVDIYDMGAPIHAFGVYVSERAPKVAALALGNQGYSTSGLTAFWQGRYYVKVSQTEGPPETGLALARATAKLLPKAPGLPAELGCLPPSHRVPNSEAFVLKSALGHSFLENVVSAQYTLGKGVVELHIAKLATAALAGTAWKKLRDFEGETAKVTLVKGVGEQAFLVRDSSAGLCLAVRKGAYVIIAFGEKADRATLTLLVKHALNATG